MCENKLYVCMRKRQPDDKTLAQYLYCKHCAVESGEDTDSAANDEVDAAHGAPTEPAQPVDMCVYKSRYQQEYDALYFQSLVNQYSLYDGTLPIIPPHENETGHRCEGAQLRYIQFDHMNMTYVYLCNKCGECFLLADPNKPLFNWKLLIPSAE